MKPRYRVTLTEQERQELEALKTGRTSAKQFLYARALLLCDAGPQGPAWTVADVAAALGVTPRTIEHLKKRFVEEGLAAALKRKQPEKPGRETHLRWGFRGPSDCLGLLGDAGRPAAMDRTIAG